jgi:hypothetical protein
MIKIAASIGSRTWVGTMPKSRPPMNVPTIETDQYWQTKFGTPKSDESAKRSDEGTAAERRNRVAAPDNGRGFFAHEGTTI